MTHVRFNRKPIDSTFSSLVDGLFSELPAVFKNGQTSQDWRGSIPVNIKENEKGYQLDVIAPGLEKQDFKISLDQKLLTISAEKKVEETKGGENTEVIREIRNEYSYKAFSRSFTLDEKIDADNIEAKYVNGVLTLNLPKKEEVKRASKDISVL
ncbi:MAG: Hsp20/alpha crystallin family protein [Chitinophagaceae bacterium]|nr:Hsp20/alpha crystallin family protein [Chitinophagaceae bacterium]